MILDEKDNQAQEYREQTRAIKHEVRGFFSTLDWDDDSVNVSRSEVNELLRAIGAQAIYAEYNATVTVTVSVNGYQAESISDIFDSITDDIEVHIGSFGSVSVDSVEVTDIELS